MAVNETKRYDKKYRVCTDAANKIWDRYSFWTAGQDVHMENGDTNSDSLTTVINNINTKIAKQGASAQAGNIIQQKNDGLYLSSTSAVSIDPSTKNIIQTTANGLYADIEISKSAGNILVNATDGLYVMAQASPDSGNILQSKTNGLYVPDNSVNITTHETNNILTKSAKDNGLYVPNPIKISDDDNNALIYGTDNGLYVNTNTKVNPSTDNLIENTSSGLYVGDPVKVKNDGTNLITKDENGELYADSSIAKVSYEPGNKLVKLSDGLYCSYDIATSENDGIMSAEDKYKLDSIVDPMSFKGSLGVDGTITELPSASSSNIGYTYKVITEGTYDGKLAKVGDTFISDGTEWVLIPSGDDGGSGGGSVMSVGLNVPTGFSVSNSPITTSGNIQLSFENGYSLPTTEKQTSWDNKQNELTTAQMTAVNSGITSTKVSTYDGYASQISGKADSSSIGNGTVTINQGGTQKGTFTLNGSSDVTIDLDAGGGASGDYLEKANPSGTGNFSLNRKADTTIGHNSIALGTDNTASNTGSIAIGYYCVSSGTVSYAEGHSTTASASYSHAEGRSTTASGGDSHAEGYSTKAKADYSHAEGKNSEASASSSHAGGDSTIASGNASFTHGNATTASNYASTAFGKYNAAMTTGGAYNNTTGTAFVIGNGTAGNIKSNAFSVQYDGTVKAKSTITGSTTADYAEFFEWLDKNPKSEDRVGYFVTLDGDKIRIANSDDDYILGIVSGEPFVLGNGDCDTWNGMYLHDEYRRTKYEPAPKTVEVLDEDGNPTGEYEEVEGEYEGTRPVLNPEYDPTRPYISRFDRKEWAPVGMLGVLAVRHDGTAVVNGYVTVNKDGIATACDRKAENSYRVIKSNSDSVVEIIFR